MGGKEWEGKGMRIVEGTAQGEVEYKRENRLERREGDWAEEKVELYGLVV